MSKFYCAAPWRGLHITPNSDVKICCAGEPKMLGNLNTQSIADILNGPKLKEIRQSIKQGIPHKYCDGCLQAERFGLGQRRWHNDKNPGFDPGVADVNAEHLPAVVDIRWNTTCNLSCNYCDVHASSKWADIKKMSVVSGTRKYYNDVCDYLKQHQEHIRDVALVGGEPLLLPENIRLLDDIPNDCPIMLITNLSIDLENNKIFKKLLNKSKVTWNVSFENLGTKFEYVRYGANWKTLEKNINILKSLSKFNHTVYVHAVYSIYNATCLVELFEWSKNLKLEINLQGLYFPPHMNPLFHNESVRKLAMAQLDQVLTRSDLTEPEEIFLKRTRANYNEPQEQNLSKEFLEYTNKLETKYHPDQYGQFAKLWPEIHKELNI